MEGDLRASLSPLGANPYGGEVGGGVMGGNKESINFIGVPRHMACSR